MILSKEEAEKRINSPLNLANRFGTGKHSVRTIPLKRPGRKEDIPNLPVKKREAISVQARIGVRQNQIAKDYGITQARVSQLENNKDKSIDVSRTDDEVAIAREQAVQTLLTSLKLITPQKLQRLKVNDLGTMAARMGNVVKSLTPEEKPQPTVQVVVYAPELRKEENFKVLEI